MQFIDLDRQYNQIGQDIKARIDKVLQHKQFIMGPEVSELEEKLKKYTGRKYAFTCSNGTDALVIPLMAYELKETDAVFVPSFTFFASAESVNLAGGTPVFIDSDDTYNLDVSKLEKSIIDTLEEGKLIPRGIIAVDIFGLSAEYNEILRIAKKYNLFVIEDAAQSFGATYHGKKTCSFGNVSTTSFFPAKPLGCYGDGGAIFTDDDELAERIHSIRVHGQGKSRYDNIRIGLNARLDTIQAAILISKMEIFEEELNQRNQIAQLYTDKLKNKFILPTIPKYCKSAWAQYSLLAESEQQREKIIVSMKEIDVPIMVYYSVPLHMQTAYKYLGYKLGTLHKCEDFSKRIFSIPMHPYLSEDEIDKICSSLIALC